MQHVANTFIKLTMTWLFLVKTDHSVSIGDVSIKLKKPSSPELVPNKYGE